MDPEKPPIDLEWDAILEELRHEHESTEERSILDQITDPGDPIGANLICVLYMSTINNDPTSPGEGSALTFLPLDVFKQILELTVDSCKAGKFNQALIFTCVSKHWRATSLMMPKLWSSMCMPVDWNAALAKGYQNCMGGVGNQGPVSLAIKEGPPSMAIYNVSSKSPVALDRLPCKGMKLHTMELHITNADNLVLFPSSWDGCEVKTLKISISKPQGLALPSAAGDPMEQFMAEAETYMLQPCQVLFKSVSLSPHRELRHLFLRRLGSLDMNQLFNAFPQLETLDIIDCTFSPLSGVPIAPELQVLRLEDCLNAPWFTSMKFPKLCELSYQVKFVDNGFDKFLVGHPTIKTLAIDETMDPSLLKIAATCAVQVTALTVTVGSGNSWLVILANKDAFPGLEYLELLYEIGPISQQKVEELLAGRGKPTDSSPEGDGSRRSFSWDKGDKKD